MEEAILQKLRANGHRVTPQRLLIARILRDAEAHITPAEIYRRANAEMAGLTESTVYRTLVFLVEQGIALAAHIGNGKLVYEYADRPHHHLICSRCDQTLHIEHSTLADLYQQLEQDTGYQLNSSHVTLFGMCPICQGDTP